MREASVFLAFIHREGRTSAAEAWRALRRGGLSGFGGSDIVHTHVGTRRRCRRVCRTLEPSADWDVDSSSGRGLPRGSAHISTTSNRALCETVQRCFEGLSLTATSESGWLSGASDEGPRWPRCALSAFAARVAVSAAPNATQGKVIDYGVGRRTFSIRATSCPGIGGCRIRAARST